MAHSSPATRKRPSHSSRPSRGRNRPPQRARIPATKLALLASALAFGSIATGAYFAFHDDVFAGLVGRQVEKQVPYEEQIADLRAQIERMGRVDQERVEQQVKTVLQRHATLEPVTLGSANDLSVQAGNGLPASGTLDPPPLLAPIEKSSASSVAVPEEKEAKQVTVGHKKAHRHNRKHARVFRKRTQKRPTIAAGGPSVYSRPAGQRDYRDY